MITGSNESTLCRRIPSVYSKTPTSSSQIHGFHLGFHIPDFSLDYQKNMKYNSNKQAVSSLTPYHSMDHTEIHSRPHILHPPEFFAHLHRVPIFSTPVWIAHNVFLCLHIICTINIWVLQNCFGYCKIVTVAGGILVNTGPGLE